MFNCKIRNSRDFKVNGTSYRSHNAVVLNKAPSNIKQSTKQYQTMRPIISIFPMTTESQLHVSPCLVEETSKHKIPCPQLSIRFVTQTHTEKKKKGNSKDHKIGWSLNGSDKRKIPPVILIFPATLNFTTYDIRWNL